MFNAESFLNSTTKSANSTAIKPVPPGEYIGIIDDIKVRAVKETAVMDILWEIPDENLREELKRKKIIARQSVWLDLTPNGELDESEGTNVQLGKLRKALDQNNPGEEWSPMMMIGRSARITVVEEVNNQTGDILEKVKSAAKLD